MRTFSRFCESKDAVFEQVRAVMDAYDASLPPEAQRAITEFVGHGPMSRDKGAPGGIMVPDLLEDAFSDKPSEMGKTIRQQLEKTFKPARAQLKRILGDPIRLYRHQRPHSGGRRNLLSWTLNLRFAQHLQGPDYTSGYSVVDADGWYIKPTWNKNRAEEMADDINSAGGVTPALQAKWKIEPDDYKLPVRAQPDPSDNHPDFGEILDKEVSLDNVIWATDRANQMEFIVKS